MQDKPEFVTVEEYEDKLDLVTLDKIADKERKNAISWEVLKKEMGWNK